MSELALHPRPARNALRQDGRVPIDPQAARDLVASPRWAADAAGERDCWLWTASCGRTGYPLTSMLKGRHVLAHRVALVAALGRDLLDRMEAGHLCHDDAHMAGMCTSSDSDPCEHRRCVNPAHLTEQSRSQNIRAIHTHCSHGHTLGPDNRRSGGAGCGICYQQAARLRRETLREARIALGLTQAQYATRYGQSETAAQQVLRTLRAAGIAGAAS